MERKKILILAASLEVGGAEKFCQQLALYAPPEYEFHYLVFHTETGAYEAALLDRGCQIFHWPKPGENYGKYLKNLVNLMKKEAYCGVHAHNMFGCGLCMLAGRLAGVPLRIAHAHSELRQGGFCRRVYETAMACLIRRFATHRLACSAESGRRLFGVSQWRTVPNGIRREDFVFTPAGRARIRRELGLNQAVVIGHAGHLNPVKNQQFLLELLPKLRKYGDFRLLFLGDGPDREMLSERILKLNLKEFVILYGNVEEMAPFYSAMDIFCLPSLYEGMPLALLEARCGGLPCFVSEHIRYRDAGVKALPLSDPDAWVAELSVIEGRIPGQVPDIRETLAPIYEIYGGNSP